jgi:hypothetical protein
VAANVNPLLGWQASTGTNMPGGMPPTNPLQTPAGSGQGPQPTQGGGLSPTTGGGALGNPGNFGNPDSMKALQGNQAVNSILSGQYRNQLAQDTALPYLQQGQQAANIFGQFANSGSPYYQQQQQASFTQGTQQAQNAAAQSRQQLGAQGYGSTPSGATAGMLGGEAQAAAGNLSMQFLQNLFNNEQLQLAGAQGLQQTASMFNPAQFLGAGTAPVNYQTTAQGLSSILGSLSGAGFSDSSASGASSGGTI